MAFLVEDGTGTDPAANSYATVEQFDAYHLDRGNDTDAVDDAEVLLIRATDYIDQRWGPVLKGFRLLDDQPLMFPRQYLYDKDGVLVEGIPNKLVFAVCEYALIASGHSLWNTPTVDASGAQIIEKTVGPLTIKYADSGGSSASAAVV